MRYLVPLMELAALFVVFLALANAQIEIAAIVILGTTAVALFVVVTGIRVPRVAGRGKAAMVLIVCMISVLSIAPRLEEAREVDLAQLKATDIEAYLAKLHDRDESRWLEELRVLRPEQHQEELERRHVEAEAARLAQCTDQKASEAYVMIQADVRRGLVAPSTAEFPGRYGAGTRHVGDCVYQVNGHFDAQNGFGAMLRGTFSGTIRYFPESGSWQTQSLSVN